MEGRQVTAMRIYPAVKDGMRLKDSEAAILASQRRAHRALSRDQLCRAGFNGRGCWNKRFAVLFLCHIQYLMGDSATES